MTDDRERWALILGASSGMGEATALALAPAGYRISASTSTSGPRSPTSTRSRRDRGGRQRGALHQHERRRRREAGRRDRIDPGAFELSRASGRHPYIRVVMHSLAFGSLVPFIADDPKERSIARRWR
jgi:NAD(P)-dependent dehydrogenase (short-subunit alcohol dehydrogenase family)